MKKNLIFHYFYKFQIILTLFGCKWDSVNLTFWDFMENWYLNAIQVYYFHVYQLCKEYFIINMYYIEVFIMYYYLHLNVANHSFEPTVHHWHIHRNY